jgi:hypothetical protein
MEHHRFSYSAPCHPFLHPIALAKEAGLLDTPLTDFLYAARSRLREMKNRDASAVAG